MRDFISIMMRVTIFAALSTVVKAQGCFEMVDTYQGECRDRDSGGTDPFHWGTSYDGSFTQTQEECANVCLSTPDCTGITVKADSNDCNVYQPHAPSALWTNWGGSDLPIAGADGRGDRRCFVKQPAPCQCDPTQSFRGAGSFTAGSTAAPCPACNGDMDGDGVVGTTDLLLLLSDFDLTHCALLSDATGDCTVNTPDLLALLAAFGNDCQCGGRQGRRSVGNGGYSGACVCADGYYGDACENVVTCPDISDTVLGAFVTYTNERFWPTTARFTCSQSGTVHSDMLCQLDGRDHLVHSSL